METASSRLRDLERAIPSLDSARLSTRFQKLLNRLKARGVDLQKPCSSIAGSTKCWMTEKLPALNEVLWTVNMQVVEHVPGALTLDCVREACIDEASTASSFLEPSCLVYWILRYHVCIKRLVLDSHAVLLRYFPTTLSKALLANKGLVEIQAHSAGSCMPKTNGCAALAHVLCQMSSRLECLNVTLLVLDHAAGDSLADGLRSCRNLRRLVLGDMPNRVARKVFGALGASQSLISLEVSTAEPLTQAHSALLKAALRGNTTLRDLTVRKLDIDTISIILQSLASNDTLKELSFEDSYYRSRFSLPDGLRVLHANSSLSCLKLTNVGFTNKCAFVLADVLRANDALQELSLRKNRISDLGAAALAKVLEQNFSLKYLDLTEGKFSCRAVSQFVQGLTRNRTVVCVRLGNVQIDEDWEPPLPLTGDIFVRIQVTWNPCKLEEWTSCLQRKGQYCPSACVRWYSEDYTEPIMQWLSAVDTSRSSLTELVVYFPFRMRDTEAVTEFASFVEEANSLKKLILHPLGNTCACPTEIITSVARNKSLCEAEFHVTLSTYREVKALQAVLTVNRTLHRLKFRCNTLPKEAPRMLARSLEANFVFLALEFDSYNTQQHMYPLLSALNRNRTLLNSAVRRVLHGTADDCSMRALQFLSASDSLLDAVVSASGRTRNQCKCLILEAVSHAECCPSMV